jgi:hypothetical protein
MISTEFKESLKKVKNVLQPYVTNKTLHEYPNVCGNFWFEEVKNIFTVRGKTRDETKMLVILLHDRPAIEIPAWALNKRDFFTALSWVDKKLAVA